MKVSIRCIALKRTQNERLTQESHMAVNRGDIWLLICRILNFNLVSGQIDHDAGIGDDNGISINITGYLKPSFFNLHADSAIG